MKKNLIFALMGLAFAVSAGAGPMATLSDLKGKIELKPENGVWAPATEGMKVDLRSTISTGFDSTVTIRIEKTKIVVKPLTRLTLDKLIEQSAGSVAASLFLRVGSVQASVKASVPGTPQDFKVQSPYSTASVRGTEFDYDGFVLVVRDGVVRLIPGRPVRDIQELPPPPEGEQNGQGDNPPPPPGSGSAEGDGFAGAAPVDAANPDSGVNVKKDQKAQVEIVHRLDTGSPPPAVTGQAENQGDGAPPRGQEGPGNAAPRLGGVKITITAKK
jgi:hypothetical protein